MLLIVRLPCLRRYDERLELAPRDIVARAIHDQLQIHGDTHVLLDISHRPSAEVLAHFPNIAAECSKAGIDVTKDPIPVVPAQHYMCGGVRTGLYGARALMHTMYPVTSERYHCFHMHAAVLSRWCVI